MWEKRIEIRWRDLDGSRHVNNAVYLSYLEEARSEWLAGVLGGREPVWEFVLARVAIDYRRELALGDEAVVVGCRLERIGTSSIRTAEQIHTAGGELAAEAEAVLVAWDQPAGASRPLRDAERAALESVAEQTPCDE
jgi:acyl-CoA thioester hydrolase